MFGTFLALRSQSKAFCLVDVSILLTTSKHKATTKNEIMSHIIGLYRAM